MPGSGGPAWALPLADLLRQTEVGEADKGLSHCGLGEADSSLELLACLRAGQQFVNDGIRQIIAEKQQELSRPGIQIVFVVSLAKNTKSTKTRAHLTLVTSEREDPAPVEVDWPLSAAPSRPSELPTRISLDLNGRACERLAVLAQAQGGADCLLARIAIEASRQLERVSHLLGVQDRALIEELDIASSKRSKLTSMTAAPLNIYVRTLRQLGPVRDRPAMDSQIEVSVPDEMASAWAAEASQCGLSVGNWASKHLLNAPTTVLQWEAAAAASSSYLSEWILVEALSAMSRRAFAQTVPDRSSPASSSAAKSSGS